MSEQQPSIVELQARWDKIRVANVYDTLDQMGYPNQCLDLGIKPLFPHRHLAGRAITVRGSAVAIPRGEQGGEWVGNYFEQLMEALYPGCVVVLECGGEQHAGKFGEMTSWALKQGGATGIVLDSYIRDWLGLEVIPDFTPCARGTSPIESNSRWRMTGLNSSIGMPGTVTSRVRVNPGDWIIGEADGVVVVPEAIAMEALVKAEELEAREQGMREDVAKGMSFDDAYKKWGRA
ncbi:MAG: dimethylmenaquinone methyltransferase [Anaerolineae bacterium]|nr:dimethylmenaquinone methyltransferase [Anaerolineae bacterium]